MAFIDYYKIMGIDRTTPQSEIRNAYKRRAKQYHPDLHPNDPKAKAKFQALNEAFEVLNNPEKRKKYDQYGKNWKDAEAYSRQQPHWSNYNTSGFEGTCDMEGNFSSIFEELFGHSQRRSFHDFNGNFGTNQNIDLNSYATIDIDMYTALLGGQIIIQTSEGKLKLSVKSGIQNGDKIRLKGKGKNGANGQKGDLILTYQIKLPTQLSERQKQLLREMQTA